MIYFPDFYQYWLSIIWAMMDKEIVREKTLGCAVKPDVIFDFAAPTAFNEVFGSSDI